MNVGGECSQQRGNTKCQMETGHKNQHGSKKRAKSFKEERLLKLSIPKDPGMS